ncbi:MAG: hypothetical protein M3Y08_09235 [Fibrobacterota bacterium]|nr:hypothetical protein [Fibrobacterota bacterium]
MVARILDVQSREIIVKTQELDVRTQELQLQKQKDQNQYQFALAALEAQRGDRDSERAHIRRIAKGAIGLVCLALILLSGTIAACIFTGNASLAVEILKGLGYLIAGGFGGWGIGRKGSKKDDSADK